MKDTLIIMTIAISIFIVIFVDFYDYEKMVIIDTDEVIEVRIDDNKIRVRGEYYFIIPIVLDERAKILSKKDGVIFINNDGMVTAHGVHNRRIILTDQIDLQTLGAKYE